MESGDIEEEGVTLSVSRTGWKQQHNDAPAMPGRGAAIGGVAKLSSKYGKFCKINCATSEIACLV